MGRRVPFVEKTVDPLHQGTKGMGPGVKLVPIPNNLQLDPRYAALHMAIAEVGHVPMFDGEHMVGEQGLHDVPLATWRECKRRRLDHIVSYVGGGCSLGRALESGG